MALKISMVEGRPGRDLEVTGQILETSLRTTMATPGFKFMFHEIFSMCLNAIFFSDGNLSFPIPGFPACVNRPCGEK